MTYPAGAKRSVRRAYSRDMARERATLTIPGYRDGGPEATKSKTIGKRPATHRSGQARVNYKRNQHLNYWTVKAIKALVG